MAPGREDTQPKQRTDRLPYVWDYDIDEQQFRRMLAGELRLGRLDRKWAAVRLLEYASYADIVRLLGFRELVRGWPEWRPLLRSKSRRRGLDFLVAWLPRNHPELVAP
jgi:hypothetical protein